jgi:hypothetical protein
MKGVRLCILTGPLKFVRIRTHLSLIAHGAHWPYMARMPLICVSALSFTIASTLLAVFIHVPFHAATFFAPIYPHLLALSVCALCVQAGA